MSAKQIGWLLRRRWWLVLAPAVLVATAAGVWALQQPALYASEGSYVVRVGETSELIRATAALLDTDEIVSTYAGIARSDLIADRARASLERAVAPVDVTTSVVSDANIVLIGSRSRDPRLAFDMATAVGRFTEAYIRQQDDAFLLSVLDAPSLPEVPTGKRVVGPVMMGGMVGLFAGLVFALAAEHGLPSAPPRRRLRNIVDERSAAFTRRYLELRLHEELSRSRDADQTFSVGVLQLLLRRKQGAEADEPATLPDAELAAITASIKSSLREQDILGYLGRGSFAAVLPDVGLDDARERVHQWQRSAASTLFRDHLGRDVMVSVAACEHLPLGFVGDPDAELVVNAL